MARIKRPIERWPSVPEVAQEGSQPVGLHISGYSLRDGPPVETGGRRISSRYLETIDRCVDHRRPNDGTFLSLDNVCRKRVLTSSEPSTSTLRRSILSTPKLVMAHEAVRTLHRTWHEAEQFPRVNHELKGQEPDPSITTRRSTLDLLPPDPRSAQNPSMPRMKCAFLRPPPKFCVTVYLDSNTTHERRPRRLLSRQAQRVRQVIPRVDKRKSN